MDASWPGDTSSLIYLAKADAFSETAFLGPIGCPPSVWREAVDQGRLAGAADVLTIERAEKRGQIRRIDLDTRTRSRAKQIAAARGLGAGESEVIALARVGHPVLVDEGKATRVAMDLGIAPISVLTLPVVGVWIRAMDVEEATELLHRLAVPTSAKSRTVTEIEQTLEGLR